MSMVGFRRHGDLRDRGVVLALSVFLAGCGGAGDGGETDSSREAEPAPAIEPSPSTASEEGVADPGGSREPMRGWFEDVTDRTGIDQFHDAGITGEYMYPESVGPGAALFDSDGDGDLDIYVVQGGRLPGTEAGDPTKSDRLYRNDGDWRFTDVTDAAGLGGSTGFGMGAFAADVEGDGDVDLYVTNVGPNVLYLNDGNGRFTDATAASGLGDPAFTLGAAFFDADADGDLDVYVANYVEWEAGSDSVCWSLASVRDYCGPSMYVGAQDRLYINRGDGTYEDATERVGMLGTLGRGMGIITADLDLDGLIDIYVTNDGDPNTLWINRGDGTFADDAIVLGAAVNADGEPEASMGVVVLDHDDDGDPDLLMTHLAGETHTLYRNDGGFFTDVSARAGLGWSGPDTGFGIVADDLDRDGDDDLVIVNGAVMRPTNPVDPARPYDEMDVVAVSEGGRWSVLPESGSPAISGPREMGRGLATGDLDGDGWLDLVVVSNRAVVRIFRGRPIAGMDDAWVGLRLAQDGANRDAIGAVVRVTAGDRVETRYVTPHTGYLGSNDPTVRVGLGEAASEPVTVSVRWPDGTSSEHAALAPGQVHRIERTEGS